MFIALSVTSIRAQVNLEQFTTENTAQHHMRPIRPPHFAFLQ